MRMGHQLSVVMLDLDNFKRINDQAGHETGDAALCMLADLLRAGLRIVDTAARFGGDEFVVILNQADTDGAMLVAERLRKSIEQMNVPGFGNVTCSLGIATFPDHGSSRDMLLLAADSRAFNSGCRTQRSASPNRFFLSQANPASSWRMRCSDFEFILDVQSQI